ncbi:lytic transglycosylase domain-containing protein [Sphaerisporangium corydalis]|uniref:Lytic transglycosylase domain-containing protein n=1 Tax=Sphaerisporangium corydalis TaxID=1441875 RepID=A0ABV9ENW9_9ACTN|nr:lytic transglycosylase domain-containing protein [Sphaerisporangium corydalis]
MDSKRAFCGAVAAVIAAAALNGTAGEAQALTGAEGTADTITGTAEPAEARTGPAETPLAPVTLFPLRARPASATWTRARPGTPIWTRTGLTVLAGGLTGTRAAARKGRTTREARTARRMPYRVHRRVWRTSARPNVRKWAPTTPKGRNKAIAYRLVTQRSWPVTQFRCLDSLWTRESNWNHRAQNPSSGAYGIPQALPGTKMVGVGHDWRVNPATQIRWGLKYIRGRYGSPCGAWGHFRSHNWY